MNEATSRLWEVQGPHTHESERGDGEYVIYTMDEFGSDDEVVGVTVHKDTADRIVEFHNTAVNAHGALKNVVFWAERLLLEQERHAKVPDNKHSKKIVEAAEQKLRELIAILNEPPA